MATMTPASDEKWRPFNCFFNRVWLRIYRHACICSAPTDALSSLYKLGTQLHSEFGRCGIVLVLFEAFLQHISGGTKNATKILENSVLGPRFEHVFPQYVSVVNMFPSDICVQKLPQQISLPKSGSVLYFN